MLVIEDNITHIIIIFKCVATNHVMVVKRWQIISWDYTTTLEHWYDGDLYDTISHRQSSQTTNYTDKQTIMNSPMRMKSDVPKG